MVDCYWFPRSIYVDRNGIAGQMLHIRSELKEFAIELNAGAYQKAMIELLDLRHSIETALRILQEKYGVSNDRVFLDADRNLAALPDSFLPLLFDRCQMFAESVLGRDVDKITVKLLLLLQAVDTEIVLLDTYAEGCIADFIRMVVNKNAVRGYYDAKRV